ncbi:GNAT family N-acetyltransferase [Gracilibacillus oryzae]|uniref:GNAT family N-acetyltransferase n=1 Tax=Gracilibacillus oryzae TaxID=1672701 RepID=A0A7C8GSW9_9BACI|nr:GNAT family N-acetyltransferase [Gracilibacillus oryzae]KAB8134690.1 GNAT family N-acetyltransferase [Gracilibacillus oryzae]
MIVELKREDFKLCKNLLNRQSHLEPISVINGTNPGRVFVDHEQKPTSGIVWLGNNDGFIFIGNAQNDKFNQALNPFIDQFIVEEAGKVNLHYMEAIGNKRAWNATLKQVFHMREHSNWNQRVYTLKNYEYLEKNEPNIDPDYKITQINKDIFKSHIVNLDYLKEKILESWQSLDDFCDNGIGFCMIADKEIASMCFSNFVAGNVHCIAIETLKKYEGNKLAQKVAHAFVKECFRQKKLPYWDCMEENEASIAVAERVGFKPYFQYIGFDISLSSQ